MAPGSSRWRVIAPAVRARRPVHRRARSRSACGSSRSASARCATRSMQVRADLAATLIRPGQFTHPAPGITLYAQSVDDDGGIHNLFVDKLAPRRARHHHHRARRQAGAPRRIADAGHAPGRRTRSSPPTGVLNFLSFDEYVVDLRPLMALDHGRPLQDFRPVSPRTLLPRYRRQPGRATNADRLAGRRPCPHHRAALQPDLHGPGARRRAVRRREPPRRTAGGSPPPPPPPWSLRTLGFAAQAAAGVVRRSNVAAIPSAPGSASAHRQRR